MKTVYCIGLDIHKKAISYCIKLVDSRILRQGQISAERNAIRKWLGEIPVIWIGAMETTMFTGWV